MTAIEMLDRAAARGVLPTALSSHEIRLQISKELRDRAVFTAKGTNVRFLGDLANVLDDYLAGKINDADARLLLLESLQRNGYTPESGFEGDESVEPAERGSLQDLSSPQRLQLILDTQAEMMFGAGQKAAGEAPDAVWAYPAWELIRIEERVKPRDWPRRWLKIGAQLVEGRIIALKDSEFWYHLGDPNWFKDALDVDHPPFAFQSGMGWRAVSREECIRLGVIEADYRPPEFDAWRLNERMKIGIANIPKDIIDAALEEIDAEVDDYDLVFKQAIAEADAAYLGGRNA